MKLCDWCHHRHATPPPDGGYGPFGDDAVCPACESAFWAWRLERERELERILSEIPDTDHAYDVARERDL